MCLPEDIVSFGGSVAVVVEEERKVAADLSLDCGRFAASEVRASPLWPDRWPSLSKVDMGNNISPMHMFSAVDIAVKPCPRGIRQMSFHAYQTGCIEYLHVTFGSHKEYITTSLPEYR